MRNVIDFIRWALTHVTPASIPEGAKLPLQLEQCATEPWHYLFGTVKSRTTRAKIQERWDNHYSKSWSKEAYDTATAAMLASDYATDCEGLLDAWLTYECDEKTDINADMNYNGWCTDKGEIADIDRPYVVGEALFCANKSGKMKHIGWVCGFDADGEPLVVEARGLWFDVVVTRLCDRPWTHRGLMTKKFNYESEDDMTVDCTKFEVKSPMLNGDGVKAMQRALNANGYTDSNGNALTEDGKWGVKSQVAFEKLLKMHSDKLSEDMPIFYVGSEDGRYKLRLSVDEAKEA